MKKIFVSYNTDSFVQLYQKMFNFKKDNLEDNITLSSEFLDNTNFLNVTVEKQKMRIECFKQIENYYKINNGKYDLYFDILNDTYQNPCLNFHIEKNEDLIKDIEFVCILFVVCDNEISFWQLQEAFFASYYNKKIILMTATKFFKILKNKKLDQYIDYQLKSK